MLIILQAREDIFRVNTYFEMTFDSDARPGCVNLHDL